MICGAACLRALEKGADPPGLGYHLFEYVREFFLGVTAVYLTVLFLSYLNRILLCEAFDKTV